MLKTCFLVFVFILLSMPPTLASEKKNVILITFDAMGARYLPFYGFEKDTAPKLNAFSNECLLFTNAISQNGTTSISLASLFTSRYPFTDNLMAEIVNFKKNELSLPYILRKMGYNTYAIVRDEYTKSKYGFDHGFNYFDENYVFSDAEETFNSAMAVVKNRLKEPFFLWIHNEEPHSPYLPPEEYFREFYRNSSLRTVYSFINRSIYRPYEVEEEKYGQFNQDLLKVSKSSASYDIYGRTVVLGSEELKQLRARYWGNIKYADEHFGRFMKHIKGQPFFDHTVVVITSDHGESLGDHHLFDHNDLFQDIIHVPLLVHLPGQNEKRIIDTPVELVDIYPTLLELLEIEVKEKIRGENLLKEKGEKAFQFSEYPWKKVIIKDKIKHVWDRASSYSYQLDKDPNELSQITEYPDVKNKFEISPLPDDISFDSKEIRETPISEKETERFWNLSSHKEIHVDSKKLKNFQLTDFIELKEKTVYAFKKGNEHLKIELIEDSAREAAQQLIDMELFQIKSLFGKSFSPYPEQLSKEIECPKELMPIYFVAEVQDERRPYLLTFSNERFGMGICSNDLISFRYLIGWIYCSHKKELYKIKYFVPRNQKDKILVDFFTTLTCQP